VCRLGRSGALGSFSPGTVILLRQEDRLIWLQVKAKTPNTKKYKKYKTTKNTWFLVWVEGKMYLN
jgi:hypothetical protein